MLPSQPFYIFLYSGTKYICSAADILSKAAISQWLFFLVARPIPTICHLRHVFVSTQCENWKLFKKKGTVADDVVRNSHNLYHSGCSFLFANRSTFSGFPGHEIENILLQHTPGWLKFVELRTLEKDWWEGGFLACKTIRHLSELLSINNAHLTINSLLFLNIFLGWWNYSYKIFYNLFNMP